MASHPTAPASRKVNPATRGRPSGSKNLSTLLSEALNEPVIVTENGRRRKVSKQQAIIKQLVNQSTNGDWRAFKLLLDIERRTEPETAEDAFGWAEEKVIEQFKARLFRKEGESND